MNSKLSGPSILLIDDKRQDLDSLKYALQNTLKQKDVEIINWVPDSNNGSSSLLDKFNSLVNDQTVLVATDYDLTSTGMRGFFGDTIIAWCKRKFIPVGDFSRAPSVLTEEPELFEIRIPANDAEGARFIANVFHGFNQIRCSLSEKDFSLESMLSLSEVLAKILERPHLDSHFALYMSRIVVNSPAFFHHVSPSPGGEVKKPIDRIQVVTYLLGHVLLNAILRYPGPILSERSLCAYLAVSNSEVETLKDFFSNAMYKGPFGEEENYFWLENIDSILAENSSQTEIQDTDSVGYEAFDDYNRKIVENALKRELEKHDCTRCDGNNGGFYCPFTERTVCQRSDCSVSASSWIPHGADLCRVERDYFDEWSPIFGL